MSNNSEFSEILDTRAREKGIGRWKKIEWALVETKRLAKRYESPEVAFFLFVYNQART